MSRGAAMAERFLGDRIVLHCGDCRELLATLPENHFDSACTDPPYHLISIVKRDRKWNDDGARKQLVQFFDAWGPIDEATIEGRKRLSSILFA